MRLSLSGFRNVVLLLVLCALATRFYRLGEASMFRDEGHTIWTCQSWSRVKANLAGYPPLYWIFEKLIVDLWGSSPWVIRLLSALSGVATVILLGTTALLAAGRRACLTVVTLTTFSTFLVSSSQEARAYMFFAALASALLLGLLLDYRQRTSKTQIAVIFFASGLVYTDYLALPVLFVAGVLFGRWRKLFITALCLGLPLYFFLGANLLAIKAGNVGATHFGKLPASSLIGLFKGLIGQIFAYGSAGSLARWIMGQSVVLLYLALLWGATGPQRIFGLFSLFGLAVSAFMNWKWGIEASAGSRATMVAPLLFMFVSVVAATTPKRSLGMVAIGTLFLTGSIDLFRGFYYHVPHRGGWKELAQWMDAKTDDEPVFVNRYLLLIGQEYSRKFRNVEELPSYHGNYYYFASDSGADPGLNSSQVLGRWRFANVFVVRLPVAPSGHVVSQTSYLPSRGGGVLGRSLDQPIIFCVR